MPWRKRTSFLFVHLQCLAIEKTFPGCLNHVVLRGQSDGCVRTLAAQPYPLLLSRAIAGAVTESLPGPVRDQPRVLGWDSSLGYPGEGTRAGVHDARKQGARCLAGTIHTEGETVKLDKLKELVYDWLRKRGLEPKPALSSVTAVVELLREYVQESFDEGKLSLHAVRRPTQGVIDEHWHLQGSITPVWKVLGSWQRGEPLDLRTPV